MTATYKISGMTCSGCASTVERALKQAEGIADVKVNLAQAEVLVTANQHVAATTLAAALVNYPSYQIQGTAEAKQKNNIFLAGYPQLEKSLYEYPQLFNGLLIGRFWNGNFLQAYYPSTSMAMQMVLATAAGLLTSVMLETVLLRVRENFSWSVAVQTAVSMSFISMVAMELAMNTTDFMITGGKAAFQNPLYWTALLVALVAGFLAPLPYNYYKLKKYNKACH